MIREAWDVTIVFVPLLEEGDDGEEEKKTKHEKNEDFFEAYKGREVVGAFVRRVR